MDEYSCDEILRELASRFVNSNGIEFCNRQLLKDVSDEIIYFLLETEENGGD